MASKKRERESETSTEYEIWGDGAGNGDSEKLVEREIKRVSVHGI